MKPLRLTPILFVCAFAQAQQPIGTILLEDATLTGDLSITNGRAVLVGSSSITARDHTAQLILSRGGAVSVCATSGLHVMQSQASPPFLVLALDRGAIELHANALANDLILTPDLRFTVKSGGPLDLRLRVTRNGDTCVENRGTTAPLLSITDAFSDASYELHRGQHVLFEHGSLKEVVDNESSPCGCPAPPPSPAAGVSVAEALLTPGIPSLPKTAAEQHPFPAAVSQGLAAPPPVPQAVTGAANAQVSTQLGFSGDGTGTIAGTPANLAQPESAAAPPPPVLPHPSFGRRVGHFFKRLFGG